MITRTMMYECVPGEPLWCPKNAWCDPKTRLCNPSRVKFWSILIGSVSLYGAILFYIQIPWEFRYCLKVLTAEESKLYEEGKRLEHEFEDLAIEKKKLEDKKKKLKLDEK